MVIGPLTVLARIGSAAEHITTGIGAAVLEVWQVFTIRGHRRTAIAVGLTVLVLYLLAIGDIVVAASGALGNEPMYQMAPGRLFHAKAPFLFEPVLVIRPSTHVTLFLSPVNIGLGAVVAVLAGANVAVARHVGRQAECRRSGYSRLLGVLPVLGLGSACCAPTVLLAIGTSTTAMLVPVMLAVRPIFYPLTVVLLGASLVWTSRPRRAPRDGARPVGMPAVHELSVRVPDQQACAESAPDERF